MFRVYARGAVIAFRRSEQDPTQAGTGNQRHRFFVLARGTRAFTFDRKPTASGGGTTVSVPVGSLALTGYAPTVSVSDNQAVAVPAGSLELIGYAPTVTTTANVLVEVPLGVLELVGYAPTVTGTFSTPDARNQGAGSNKKRQRRVRYIAEHRGEEYEFASLEALEAFVAEKQKTEQRKPRKERKAVRIELSPDYVEEVAERVKPPVLTYTTPPAVALEQIKKFEARVKQTEEEDEDDEVLLWLM